MTAPLGGEVGARRRGPTALELAVLRGGAYAIAACPARPGEFVAASQALGSEPFEVPARVFAAYLGGSRTARHQLEQEMQAQRAERMLGQPSWGSGGLRGGAGRAD